jgi:Chitin binding Peritrophin-A domain
MVIWVATIIILFSSHFCFFNFQIFHICENGRKISFLCPNGTIFRQSDNLCEWWFNVECSSVQNSNSKLNFINEKKIVNHNNNHFRSNPLKFPHSENRRLDHIPQGQTSTDIGVKNGQSQKLDLLRYSNYFQQNILKSYPLGSKEIQDTAESASFIEIGNSGNRFGIPMAKHLESSILYNNPHPFRMRTPPQIKKDEPKGRDIRTLLNVQTVNGEKSNRGRQTYSTNNVATNRPIGESLKEVAFYTPTIPTVNIRRPTILSRKNHPTLTTIATRTTTEASNIIKNISNHAIEMIKSLENLSIDTKQTEKKLGARPGLEVPPSSGPNALHTLALYFATMDPVANQKTTNDLKNGSHAGQLTQIQDRIDFVDDEELGISVAYLSNNTLKKYEKIFETKKISNESLASLNNRNSPSENFNNDLEGEFSRHSILTTSGSPQIRELAQVFTHALSAYLQDPNTFRKILSEIRPTEPPAISTYSNEIDYRSGRADLLFEEESSYSKNQLTTTSPSTFDDLEVLNFSDDTSNLNKAILLENYETTTPVWTTESTVEHAASLKKNIQNGSRHIPLKKYLIDKTPGSRIITEKLEKNANVFFISRRGKKVNSIKNPVAMEVNELFSTTNYPEVTSYDYFPQEVKLTDKPNGFKIDQRTEPPGTNEYLAATTLPSIAAISPELQPPFELNSVIETPSKFFKPPTTFHEEFQNDEQNFEQLVQAQSQSFIPRERSRYFDYKTFSDEIRVPEDTEKDNTTTQYPVVLKNISGHFITEKIQEFSESFTSTVAPDLSESTLSYIFLDPLTINDGLMNSNEEVTVTPSPHTYLPKNNIGNIQPSEKPSTRKRSDSVIEVNNKFDSMQKKATKMFGGLNETQADHLMNVMKNADKNYVVRRLILLLIQICEGDFNKTVENSRKALLDALLNMNINDPVTINYEKKGKSLDINTNLQIIGTNYNEERSSRELISKFNDLNDTEKHGSPTTDAYDPVSYSFTTDNPITESTTNFNDWGTQPVDDFNFMTKNPTTAFNYETTTDFSSNDGISTTNEPTTMSTESTTPITMRRMQKSLGSNDESLDKGKIKISERRSTDARALELLRSLYELATKWSG